MQRVTILTADSETMQNEYSSVELIRIYPNPAEQYLFCPQLSKCFNNIIICTIAGEVVTSLADQHHGYIDVHKLEKGIYLLKGNNKETPFSFRFVVK